MTNDYTYNFKYDSCSSRGLCSTNPKTASLQEILVLYLKISAYYALKTFDNKIEQNIQNLILKTLSIMTSNSDFSESDFKTLTKEFINELPKLIKSYEEICAQQNTIPEYLKTNFKFNRKQNIVKSAIQGEKEFLSIIKQTPAEIVNYYRIFFIIAKSLSSNILDYKSYNKNIDYFYSKLLELLNSLNSEFQNKNELKKIISDSVTVNHELSEKIREIQIENYGIQREKIVSFSTTPSKAILVVGSNIKELEIILEKVCNTEIDVYTHDDMMLAHTFPAFDKYKNLKGQYGQGMDSCLLDFSTFPGPIILTSHSLYNVENLYRGRLYTTDIANSKGIVQIKDYDLSDVIKTAEEMRGFKKGKECQSELIGFDYESTISEIKNKINTNNYKNIIICGSYNNYQDNVEYFENLYTKISEDNLIISLTPSEKKYNNLISINGCFDFYALTKITEEVKKVSNSKISVFIPLCNRNTLLTTMYLSIQPNITVFIGKCSPLTINPPLINTLKEDFNIQEISTVKKDLEKILDSK